MSKSCITSFLVVFLVAMLNVDAASAMTFQVVNMKGEPAIRARGEIVAGDASRFIAVLTAKAKHSLGYYTLILDSPGGSVTAAFEISRVMDAHYVNTYVAPGEKCISACAAIVFISGREHVVVRGGILGFHGCFDSNTKKIDSLCNDAISLNAFAHGTSYGSVMAFIENIPHNQVVWISSSEADCWAINRYDISPEPANYMLCVTEMLKKMKR